VAGAEGSGAGLEGAGADVVGAGAGLSVADGEGLAVGVPVGSSVGVSEGVWDGDSDAAGVAAGGVSAVVTLVKAAAPPPRAIAPAVVKVMRALLAARLVRIGMETSGISRLDCSLDISRTGLRLPHRVFGLA
jgi:hypothetical protein